MDHDKTNRQPAYAYIKKKKRTIIAGSVRGILQTTLLLFTLKGVWAFATQVAKCNVFYHLDAAESNVYLGANIDSVI